MANEVDMEEYVFVDHVPDSAQSCTSSPATSPLIRSSWYNTSTSHLNGSLTKIKDWLPLQKVRLQEAESQVCLIAVFSACMCTAIRLALFPSSQHACIQPPGFASLPPSEDACIQPPGLPRCRLLSMHVYSHQVCSFALLRACMLKATNKAGPGYLSVGTMSARALSLLSVG